jgi:ubiquinone/menaquinone biosynthesis C-methylase UbiE
MQDDVQWQLRGSAPELYERYLVPAITALWATDLIERAAPQPGEHILDLACGTGIVARLAAARMSSGHVIGVDINPGMLAVARSLSRNAGSLIDWQDGSALDLAFPAGTFNLVFCQLGLQFFPDRSAALGEMRRVLVPFGRIALSVFTAIEYTPATNALADALDRRLGAGASQTKRSEHCLSNAQELRDLVMAAGFRNVALETVTQIIRFPSAAEYVRIQLSATPLSALLDGMDSNGRQQLLEELTRDLVASLRLVPATAELTYPQQAYVLLANK